MPHKKKYAAIASTLGWEEYEVREDGLFLQPEEASAIDLALVTSVQTAADLVTANGTIVSLNETITGLQGTIDAANTAQATANNRITELEAQVTELGKGSSGTGTVVTTTEDTVVKSGNENITINHPDHPLNVAVKKRLAATKKK